MVRRLTPEEIARVEAHLTHTLAESLTSRFPSGLLSIQVLAALQQLRRTGVYVRDTEPHKRPHRWRLVAGSVELESVGLRGIILNGRLTSLRKPPMAALMAPATPPRHACLRPSTSVERRGEQARPAALHSFICPITHEIMRDPVVAADGHSYERAAISQWLSRGCTPGTLHRSPCTNLPLQHARLTPNHSLRCAISEWRHCER